MGPRLVFLGPYSPGRVTFAQQLGEQLAARCAAEIVHVAFPGHKGIALAALEADLLRTAPPRVLVIEADHIDRDAVALLGPVLDDPTTSLLVAAASEEVLRQTGLDRYLRLARRFHCHLSDRRLAGWPQPSK
jgi:hypothetical protein